MYYLPLDLDFIILQSVINFGPTDTSQTISVLAVDDDVLEYMETFTMGIVIADDLSEIGVLPGENNITSVSIKDNDSKKSFNCIFKCNCIL